jgi:hypothetical protein
MEAVVRDFGNRNRDEDPVIHFYELFLTGGDSGGTPEGKDGEIRVRMGKFYCQPWLGRGATTGVFGRGCVETKGLKLAPQVKQRVFHAGETLAKLLIPDGLLKFASFARWQLRRSK